MLRVVRIVSMPDKMVSGIYSGFTYSISVSTKVEFAFRPFRIDKVKYHLGDGIDVSHVSSCVLEEGIVILIQLVSKDKQGVSR